MKGISPMIAIVLLIAFTVAVGGLISIFFTGLTTTQTGITEATATNQTKCAGVYLKIDSVTSSEVLYSNPTIETITSITFVTDDGIITTGATSLSSGASDTINATHGWARGTNTSVTALGKCQDSIIIKGKCESGQACWD